MQLLQCWCEDMRKQLILPLIESLCSEIGIKIIIEPSRGMYGVLCFKSGKKFYVKDVNFNINHISSAGIAKNKAVSSFFLTEHGYKTPEFTMVSNKIPKHDSVFQNTLEAGLDFSRTVGFPVVLKPNNLSQGRLVFIANSEEEYRYYSKTILDTSDSFQVQRYYSGNDYRVVILNGEVLSAYQRKPFHVIGNGKSSIIDLIRDKQCLFQSIGRDTVIDESDIRIAHKLRRQNLSFEDVPQDGKVVFLQDISNLSAGGETIELTDSIHHSFRNLCKAIACDMNLELCGIDIIATDITSPLNDYVIIEINSAPGLDNYAYIGTKQDAYVRELYKNVLLYIKSKYEC